MGLIPGNELPGYVHLVPPGQRPTSLEGTTTGPEHMSAKATPPWAFLEDEDDDEDEDEGGVVNGGKLDSLFAGRSQFLSENSACTILTSQLTWFL